MLPTRPVLSPSSLSPSLLALALWWGSAALADAATADEREVHFAAAQGLIERGIRPSAERIKVAFRDAGYPDAKFYQKALDWFYANRFKEAITDAKIAAQLAAESDTLRKELVAAEKSGQLPPTIVAFLNGAGDPARRLVNELHTFLEPDALRPVIEPGPERRELAKRQIASLLEAAQDGWNRNLRRVTANKAAEEKVWDLDEKDPKFKSIAMEAVGARADALRGVYSAHLVLREVITRGATWGLDPAPVATFFKTFLTANAKVIKDWEYTWGDFQPDLKAFANILLLEGVRQKVPDMNQDEIETELQKVLDIDRSSFKPDVAEAVLEIQLKSWTALLKSRMELGRPEDFKKGTQYWDSFKERIRGLSDMKPACRVAARAPALGQLWITAGRLLEAKGDKAAATALYGEVAAAGRFQPGPIVAAATSRLRGGGGGADAGGDWAKPTQAQDPAQAISVARVLLKEADATADAARARDQRLRAATLLRGGIAGLATVTDDVYASTAPDVYSLYASVFSKLDLRWHAAIAAQEGLAAMASRISPKGNPWKKADAWTPDGQKVLALSRNTLALASQLYSRAKGTGAQRLYDGSIDLVKAVAPELAGESLEWNQIVFRFSEGDFSGVVDAAAAYGRKYPEQEVKAFGLVSSARMSLIEEAKKRKDEAGAKKIADGMLADSDAMIAKATKALEDPKLDEAKAREWHKAMTTAQSSRISLLMTDEKYAEVLKRLDADYWKTPPSDETLRGRMLRNLVKATQSQEFARVKDETAKADAAALAASWPQAEFTYTTWKRLTPGLKDPEERTKTERSSRFLGALFQWYASAATSFAGKDGMAAIALSAKRNMADCLEPGLSEKDKPQTILAIAETLWSLDEHERAVRLYELFRRQAGSAASADPKPILDNVAALAGDRPELKADWAKLRDLVEDRPELADLIRQGVPHDQWKEEKADFVAALVSLRAFRDKVDTLKTKLADGYPKTVDALKALDSLLQSRVDDLAVRSRLASGYRELGRKDDARALFQQLYAYDPNNGTYASAIVDITLDQVRGGQVATGEIAKAIEIAKNIRNDAGKDRDLYWQASIQVFELSLANKDAATVNQDLRFLSVDRSGPNQDLIQPGVIGDHAQTGDDKRVRRARNALAVELAKRYLALFKAPGITESAPFAIQELTAPGGRTLTIFADVGAPTFKVVTVPNADEVDTTIIVDDSSTGIAPKVATPAAATPAPAPAPAPAK